MSSASSNEDLLMRLKSGSKCRTNSPSYLFLYLLWHIQVADRRTSLFGGFIEIKSNLERKNFHRMNQGANFLVGSFNNKDNVKVPIHFRKERLVPFISRQWHHSLFNWSFKTNWFFPALQSISHFLPQSIVPHRSDSISEARYLE